jgi:UDP-N-acetyl-D-mannosaminuronic acid dehydrogenase
MRVLGVDVNRQVVEILRNGGIHIQEPGLRSLVQAAFQSGNLTVSDTPASADAFIIAVPTPITDDKRADMRYVRSAAESIIPHLRRGNLVVLESTSPPRTTLDLLTPILEQGGLTAGEDFYLAYSPERVLPGKILHELVENARVIGGVNQASSEAGRELYASFVQGEILLTDSTTAEMVKLMENTYRDVNIAIANEFSRLGDKFQIDIWRAIELANLDPRVQILNPGPGVGGHCISVDPWFLVEAAPEVSSLIRQARLVNDGQPAVVLELVRRALGNLDGKRIAALGLSYKANVDDLRESPALEVVRLLTGAGAQVRTFEPFALQAAPEGALAAETLQSALADAEAILLLVDHEQFRTLEPQAVASMTQARILIDTRRIFDRESWEQAGFQVFTIGVRLSDG